MKLISKGDLEVLYSLTGKEYITPRHLEREILDELLAQRGLMDPYLNEITNL